MEIAAAAVQVMYDAADPLDLLQISHAFRPIDLPVDQDAGLRKHRFKLA